MGSWIQYPPAITKPSSLRPTAIVITHEHSDHFHVSTLKQFDRAIPIYVPDFPNRRLPLILSDLGYTEIRTMSFGDVYQVSDDVSISCFEPGSQWNDTVVLFEFDGFRLLNLNDSGLNPRVAGAVGPVDVIASSFSPGSSGYPLTWNHLDKDEKTSILERDRTGMLEMLRQAVEMYGAEAVLPFASHFALWHPSHREFQWKMRWNRIDDVVAAFDGTETDVIDVLPGETWNVSDHAISRRWNREGLYDRKRVASYLDNRFKNDEFLAHHPVQEELTLSEVIDYLERLNESPQIILCENLVATLQGVSSGGQDFVVSFEIKDGTLSMLDSPVEDPNVLMQVPVGVLRDIIQHNLSWDEAHIGYWCRFQRSPDTYHAGFWRLLQAPYFRRFDKVASENLDDFAISAASVIGEVIEHVGSNADRIMRRRGLYCVGCSHSPFETLEGGARAHGLSPSELQEMIHELRAEVEFSPIELCQRDAYPVAAPAATDGKLATASDRAAAVRRDRFTPLSLSDETHFPLAAND